MMGPVGLLDTGPLVSFLATGLEHHEWATEAWKAAAPPAVDVRAGAHGSGISAETRGARYGSSVRSIGSRSHSDRPFHSGTASGPPGTHAALSKSADVTGGRLPGPAL